MNRKTILTGIAAFATTMAFGLAAQADNFTWTGNTNSNWSLAANWYNVDRGSVSGYPNDAGDAAIFNSTSPSSPISVVLTQDEIVGHMDVLDGRAVTISAPSGGPYRLDLTAGGENGKLIIDSNASSVLSLGQDTVLALNSAVTHEFGNLLVLTAQSANDEPVMEVNANTTFGPFSGAYGAVKGENAAARIDIVASATLTSQITLQGMMEMRAQSGTATFVNSRVNASAASGLVRADDAGVFKLNSNLILSDSSSSPGSYLPVWKALNTQTSAELQFNRAAGSLIGDFADVGCNARLRFNANVATSGSLTTHTGIIHAVSGTFVATGGASSYNSGSFSQPDTSCP